MKKRLLVALSILALLILACSISVGSPETIQGSGVVASENRPVSGFNAIQLAGSAEVTVHFDQAETVVVEADDNILPLVETVVRGGRLVINIEPNTSIRTTNPIHVMVTMKSLEAASLPGSGSITIAGLDTRSVAFDLPGSGNITVDGRVDSMNVTLDGSGNLLCGELQAQSARVDLSGSGNVTVFASESLDATIRGSGNVFYRGSPAKVNKSVPGSGNVLAEP